MASYINNLATCARKILYSHIHDVDSQLCAPRPNRKTLNIKLISVYH